MSHPDDWAEFRHCIRLTREIFAQSAFDPFRGRKFRRARTLPVGRTARRLHPGSLRERLPSMRHLQDGPRRRSDMSVVDPECRVIGVDGLRVADSSIFPRVTNGNLNAPLDHDRREGIRPHSWPHAAGAVQPGTLDQSALAGLRQIEHHPARPDMTATTYQTGADDLDARPAQRHRTMSTAATSTTKAARRCRSSIRRPARSSPCCIRRRRTCWNWPSRQRAQHSRPGRG
jgi:hypothetical protein